MKAQTKLLVMAVVAILALCGPAWADLTDGLVAHWKLDGDANDSAGTNDGTLVNGPVWTTGQIDDALSFSGGDDYVDCGNSFASVTGSTTKTITAWAKSDVSDRSGRIITLYRRSDSYSAFVIYPRENDGDNPATWKGLYATPGNGHNLIDSEIPVTADEWTHIALVQDGANVHIYVDSELKNSVSGAAAPAISSPPHAVIGTYMWYGHGPSASFLGTIDDVRIYNRALSANEIRQLYGIELTSLEIEGPDTAAENSQAQYKAIAHYDNDTTRDVTASADWAVEPNDLANIQAGLLTTEPLDLPEDVIIIAQYSEGGIPQNAEKQVSILTICPSGSALEFDGQNDYVDCGNDESLNVTELTWALWIKREETTYSNERALISNTGPKTSPGEASGTYALQIDEGGQYQDKIQFVIHGGLPVQQSPLSKTAITDTNWHHIAVTRYINGDVTIYIDGCEDATGYLPERTAYGKTFIGTGHTSYSNFKGSIDEVVIYNRALTAEEIQGLMHTRPDTDDPTLVGYWDFDEGEGEIAQDSSDTGNDGTVVGAAWSDDAAPVGICTLDGLVERNISNVLDIKSEIIDLLDIALGKEDALLDYMDEAFHKGQLDNLNKGDVVKAKQKIFSAIQQEEQAETAVGQSIEKLEDALAALDIWLDAE